MNQLTRGSQEAIDWIGQIAAICSIHRPAGCGWIPAMCTRRVCSAITKTTKYRRRPARVSTSTVNRSAAARPSQCVCRNVFQGVRWVRSGAGSSPGSCKIRFTVFRAMWWPRLASAPRTACRPTSDAHPPSVRRVRPPPRVSSAVPDAGGHGHRTAGRSAAGTSGESCQA